MIGRMARRLAPIFALACASAFAANVPTSARPSIPSNEALRVNFSGPYAACDGAAELVKTGHLNLGVRFASRDARLNAQFRRALDFWAKTLDMKWHTENSAACSIALVDGAPELFDGPFAVSQFTDWSGFHGQVAFDPRLEDCLSDEDMFTTAVHEIAHLLGLRHNGNPASIMYADDPEFHGAMFLDRTDLAALAARHALRRRVEPVFVTAAVRPPVPEL